MGAAFWPLIFVPLSESSGRMSGHLVRESMFDSHDEVIQDQPEKVIV